MSDMNIDMNEFDALFAPEVTSQVTNGKVLDDGAIAERLTKQYEEKVAKRNAKPSSEDFEWDIPEEDQAFYQKDTEDDGSGYDTNSGDGDDTADLRDTTQVDSEEVNPVTFFINLPDDAEIAPGLSKAEITNMIRERDDYTQKYEFMNHQFNEFEKGTEYIKNILGRNLTETHRTILAIQNKMNRPDIDNVTRGQLYQELQLQKAKLQQIEGDWQQADQTRTAQERYANEQRYFYTNDIMAKKYGREWNPKDVAEYAVSMGFDVPTLERSFTPNLAETLLKAMKYDGIAKHRNETYNKITAKAPRSGSSSKQEIDRAEENSSGKRNALKAAHNGDFSNAFEYLED